MAAFHLTIMSISFNLNTDTVYKFCVLSKTHSDIAGAGGTLVHSHSESLMLIFSADFLSLGG